MSISSPVYFATVSERDWELDVFIRNRIGISAACAYIIRMRGLRRPVAAAVVVHVSGSLCKKHYDCKTLSAYRYYEVTAQTTSDGWCAVVGTAAEVTTAGALQWCVCVAVEDSKLTANCHIISTVIQPSQNHPFLYKGLAITFMG